MLIIIIYCTRTATIDIYSIFYVEFKVGTNKSLNPKSHDDMSENENGDPKKKAVPTWLVAARAELDAAVDDDDGGGSCDDKNDERKANKSNKNNYGSSSGNNVTMTNNNMTTIRQQFGNSQSTISDTINSNLIIVRYVTLSSVVLLGAYGIVNTPLFFRYKAISELPVRLFAKRHWLHGRIVGIISNSNVAGPISILFRHYSPIERLLGRPLFTTTTSAFRAVGGGGMASNTRNLLRIELAGLIGPPTTISTYQSLRNNNSLLSPSLTAGISITPPTNTTATFPLLNQLIQQKNKVSLQLLAVQRSVKTTSINNSNSNNHNFNTLILPQAAIDDENDKSSIICHLHYQELSTQWFTTTNVSLQLVRLGQAMLTPGGGSLVRAVSSPSSSSEGSNSSSGKSNAPNNGSLTKIIINYNPTVKQLQQDTKFITKLEEAEKFSWKDKVGIWSNDEIRQQLRKDYVEEEERMNKSWWMVVKKGWKKIMMARSSSQ